MKLLLQILFFIAPISIHAQWSVFGAFSLDPISAEIYDEYESFEDQPTITKEFNIGICRKMNDYISIRAGLSRLDKRMANNVSFIQDHQIDGFFVEYLSLNLRHSSGIRNYSTFGGLQLDLNRFHIGSHLHYTYSVFKDEAIIGRDYSSVTGATLETHYDIDYENIGFLRADVNVSLDLICSKQGTISLVAKYMRDFSADERFTVKNVDDGVKQMVEEFPGSSYYDIDEFLEGGQLFYNRQFWGIGLRMSYNLGVSE